MCNGEGNGTGTRSLDKARVAERTSSKMKNWFLYPNDMKNWWGYLITAGLVIVIFSTTFLDIIGFYELSRYR